MYVLPASSFSKNQCHESIAIGKELDKNYNYPAGPKHISSSCSNVHHRFHLFSFVRFHTWFHTFPFQPQPSRPPKLPVVGATTCRRGLLWLREPLAIGDRTTTSGSPGRKWWQKWIQKDKWYCDMMIIWGWFWDYLEMILGIIVEMLWSYDLILQ